MFGRRKDEEDPFAALKNDGTYQSAPSTLPDFGLGGDPPSVSPSSTPPPAQPPQPAQPTGSITASPVSYSSPPANTGDPAEPAAREGIGRL